MELLNLTVHELRDMIKSKKVSSLEATTACLSHIENIDGNIGSFINVLYDEAIACAKENDKKLSMGLNSGSIFGVPYALKDNILTKGIKTTCASKMLENFIPPYSATVENKIKSQGGILLGKLNMDEFAMGSSTENSYFKVTRNPYDISKMPGGSSGGSATAVASDEAFFSLGTDTGGSIRQPAAFCSCVGLKPTYGRVSRYGLVAFASSLDQIGPLTKDVLDSAIILDVISGKDNKDSTTFKTSDISFESALTGEICGTKIGVPVEYLDNINKEVLSSLSASIENLKKLGAICEETSLKLYKHALPSYYLISSGEACSNLARFDGVKYGYSEENCDTLTDLYEKSRSSGFGNEVKRRILLGTYILSSKNYHAYFKKAQQVRTLIIEEFNRLFEKYDVLVTPAYPTVASEIGQSCTSIEMYVGGNCLACVNLAGLPAIVIPCGYDKNGLPIGIQIIGKYFDEATILNVAYALEKTVLLKKPSLTGGAK